MRRVLFGCTLSLLLIVVGAHNLMAEDGISRRQRRMQQFRMLEARGGSSEGGIRDLLAGDGKGDGIRDLMDAGGGRQGIRDLLSKSGSRGIRDLLADEADRNIRDLFVKMSSSGGGIRDLLVKLSSKGGGGGEIRDLLARMPKPSDTEGVDLREWVLANRGGGKIRDLLAAGEGPEGIRDLLAKIVANGKIRDLLIGQDVAKDATLRACLTAISDAPTERVRTVFGTHADKLSLTIRPLLAAKASASGTGGIRDLLAEASDPGIRDLLWDLSNASDATVKAVEMAIKGP